MTPKRDIAVAVFLALGFLALVLPLGEGRSWVSEPVAAALWLAALALGACLALFRGGLRPPHSVSLPKGREDALSSPHGKIWASSPSPQGEWAAASSSLSLGKRAASSPSPLGERVGVRGDSAEVILAVGAAAIGAFALFRLIEAGVRGESAAGLWCAVLALGFLVWRAMERTASLAAASGSRFLNLAVPGILGLWVLFLWQVMTEGFSIPSVLLPAPSGIGQAIISAPDTLAQDFVQTAMKCVIPGYVIGNLAGFATALLVDRFVFLKRGLLPIGNLFSSLPIVGLAPIMVMWFGFDWQSKAAIVVVMTFFPMLVNTIAGLAQTSQIERDLMRTYAASFWQTMVKVRLPAALPFIFNALKINSTLALIGAIVAEFFGSPTVGLGFRISTEVGRMNIVMVWAAIAVAAVAGSAFYGLLALLERRAAFWHPSFRQGT